MMFRGEGLKNCVELSHKKGEFRGEERNVCKHFVQTAQVLSLQSRDLLGEVFSERDWALVAKTSDGFDVFRVGCMRSFGAHEMIRYPCY